MFSLIAFLIVVIGGANWLTIGLLQYDFVAGMFGSQANIFSRLIYALVGIATVFMIYSAIKNKGKVISFNKKEKNIIPFLNKDEKKEQTADKQSAIQQKNDSIKSRQKRTLPSSDEEYERAKAYRSDHNDINHSEE